MSHGSIEYGGLPKSDETHPMDNERSADAIVEWIRAQCVVRSFHRHELWPPRPRMMVVAGPPGSGKTRYFPVTAFGVNAFNIYDRCAQILGSYHDDG